MGLNLTDPIFTDEAAARAWLEGVRWPAGAFCPHCGSFGVTRMDDGAHRAGLYNCRDCRKQFSVTVGTVFERSHVPLHKWVLANHLMNASRKGMSAKQLERMLGVTYKTAWFMGDRIREAMTDLTPRRSADRARSSKRTKCTTASVRCRSSARSGAIAPSPKGERAAPARSAS